MDREEEQEQVNTHADETQVTPSRWTPEKQRKCRKIKQIIRQVDE